ncbi:N-acetylmuramoyl-L-alanine amidase-like domain-containing protein [Pseudobacteriovorax antillogorgiicola]|uniref:DUF1460 domain-containing protein n=1 Tax=Pseudobacteriovorax antillogorgiicola TaxID=1513793 RepID=A0A1Y6BEL2_9BACT|nr:N-acetylmuramoyl-L-alanine amidase-like domain-containing protein [Pseudobacteriovorax antillogorgiicola]TCS56435.1 uncharacterized protein DUF1460 [Pseudobacteriovorax antillogorgiicola]SMF05519.1 Protein of unknown function [Pseudobacteriovorax antillogorgiicola]
MLLKSEKEARFYSASLCLLILAQLGLGNDPIRANTAGIALVQASEAFIGAPYSSHQSVLLRPLDKAPQFDCQTLVEATLSRVMSRGQQDYYHHLHQLRYFKKPETEAYRRHFMSSDWLPNLWQKQVLIDETAKLFPKAKTISRRIDKVQWFLKTKEKRDHEAFTKSGLPQTPQARLAFIPISELYHETRETVALFPGSNDPVNLVKARAKLKPLAAKIPTGALLVFVSRNPDRFIEKIGSPLIVGHLGIAVRKDQKLFLRHADLPRDTVIDIPLETFLRSNSHKYQGIHISTYQANANKL